MGTKSDSKASGNENETRGYPEEDWLFKLLSLPQSKLDLMREEVEALIRECETEAVGKGKNSMAHYASSRLIKQCAAKAAMVGSITSLPATIPGIGTIGTAVFGTVVDLTCLIRIQIEMCYKIAFAHSVTIDAEELKALVLALIGVGSSSGIVKGITGSALKSAVDEIAKKYVSYGLKKQSVELSGELVKRLLGRSYKLIPFISIPISASLNISSVMVVGNQARKYFTAFDN